MSKTYYFSSKKRPFEDGSSLHPFSSFKVLDSLMLEKGDRILIACNSIFLNEFIHLHNKEGIIISTYGNGTKPIIDANGAGVWHQDYHRALDNPNHRFCADVSSTILLYDCNQITIENLEIRNSTQDMANYSAALKQPRTGIAVIAQERGTIYGITLCGLNVNSVHGNVYDKHLCNGGIYFASLKPSNPDISCIPRFDQVLISKCLVKDVSRWGIAVGYTYLWDKFSGTKTSEEVFKQYGNTNIGIEDTYVKNIGGDGITVMYALHPQVKHCRADSVALEMNDRIYTEPLKRQGKVAAGIWPWKCFEAHFEFNEVYDTKLNQDGMAYDADSGWNTLYENNYSHSNEGGAMMFCQEEAIGSIYKNNVSNDDLGGIFSPISCPEGIIEGNAIYRRESVPLLRNRMSDGKFSYENNQDIIIKRKR